MSTRRLFELTADAAAGFLESLPDRGVEATATVEELRSRLGGPLPDGPSDPELVITDLVRDADPGLVGIAGAGTSAS